MKGMKKCLKLCPACHYIKEGKSIKINNKEWKMNKPYNWNSYNVVYAVIWKKENCEKTYLGETKKNAKILFSRPLWLCQESNPRQIHM